MFQADSRSWHGSSAYRMGPPLAAWVLRLPHGSSACRMGPPLAAWVLCLPHGSSACRMGPPLRPTFANGFMCCHGNIWLTDSPAVLKLILCQRYVDDTFLLFRHRSHSNLFLSYLISNHSHVKFISD